MPSDVVRVICPSLRCRAILSVPFHARGKSVRCRKCGMRVQVPALASKPTDAAPDKASPSKADQ